MCAVSSLHELFLCCGLNQGLCEAGNERHHLSFKLHSMLHGNSIKFNIFLLLLYYFHILLKFKSTRFIVLLLVVSVVVATRPCVNVYKVMFFIIIFFFFPFISFHFINNILFFVLYHILGLYSFIFYMNEKKTISKKTEWTFFLNTHSYI